MGVRIAMLAGGIRGMGPFVLGTTVFRMPSTIWTASFRAKNQEIDGLRRPGLLQEQLCVDARGGFCKMSSVCHRD